MEAAGFWMTMDRSVSSVHVACTGNVVLESKWMTLIVLINPLGTFPRGGRYGNTC